ncbi:hypothetical protein [Phytomonospora endophytica]|uniref:Uncharacterized protein n=1 Tax=Phytomonospora endophytica TaxID=714109 RepID=A0A841FIW1_9ACTN|nr:hypothetical protein [Phytomonospora endophytica]MBB6033087.1 hypothetical protein [Phytomonospora endophytica]GIG65314.1 hypothetical protein Pen01_16090 [Phytomonospora endophytica]
MKKSGAEVVARVALAIGGLQFLVGGVWAFFWPANFYDTVASFPPFNLHLFHDVGAFQLGLAAALFGCLFWTDVLLAGLFGGAVGTVTHAISHLVDRDLGGSPSDPYTTAALAIVLLAGLIARTSSYRRERRRSS